MQSIYILLSVFIVVACLECATSQISNDPIYTFSKTDGVYCSTPMVKWVGPTIQAIQDRLDLQDFSIELDSIEYVKLLSKINDEDLSYTLYQPIGSTAPKRPLIIFAHGGGFLIGGRESKSIKFLCEELAKHGYATASIEYRLRAINTFSMVEAGYMAMQDGNAAIKYFKANSRKFKVDPNKIFVAGISAGGILALHSGHFDQGDVLSGATVDLDANYGCYDCTGSHISLSNSVAGVINIVGATPSPSILDSDLPTLHIYCPLDSVVPAYSGIPLNKYSGSSNSNSITKWFYDQLLKIKRPKVFGPLYFQKNLRLTAHEFVDISKIQRGTCSHSIFTSRNGTIKSSGKAALSEIKKWLRKQLVTKLQIPQRKIQQNHWSTYSLPSSVHTHSFKGNSGISYKKISGNTFQIMPTNIGPQAFAITAIDSLGLEYPLTINVDGTIKPTSVELPRRIVKKANYAIIFLSALSLLIILFLLRKLLWQY